MSGPSRQTVLAGVAAALVTAPLRAAAPSALDRAAALVGRDPVAALRELTGVVGATPGERLDLAVARAGLRIDIALAHAPASSRDRYTLLLRRRTGDDVAPVAAERRLEQERRRLTRRAMALFATIGDTAGGIGERYTRLWRDLHFLHAADDTGRDRAVADMSRTLAAIRPHLPAAFGPPPAPVLDVTGARLTPADEAAGRGGYRTLPEPGWRGAYVVDLRDIARRPSWTLPSAVAHETLPGHLLQLPIEAAAHPHPLRLEYAPGFAEGWATYAEALAADRGWLGDDPRVMLGHLHWLLFRVNRALADLAIHWHGRDRAMVRAELVERQGEPAYFAPFDTELDRIVREPATWVGEALFWLGIADAAHGLSGDRLRAFHDRILTPGRVRLDMLYRRR